ncbi:acetyl ornithine aminotransferase family protein [Vampirovibrio sp.]|uniref:acetyl ornithine aminotransferase family protein n=1 Tax=Vampirovibrio sp. TaxID=2717857 RepID=UPI003592F908
MRNHASLWEGAIQPHIQTELPGPKTKALIEKDSHYLSPSYTRGYPLSIKRGYGAMVVDMDDNLFLDYCAGIAVCSTGHSHPAVVQTIQEQSAQFLHMSGTDFYYTVMAELAEKLATTTPGTPDKKVFFGNSGTEANEAALKLARYHTGRKGYISFYRSFHGRTFGSMSVSASKSVQRKHFMPLVPGVFHAHYPYFYRDIFKSETPEACAEACLNYIEDYIFKLLTPPDEIAAFIVEPIQGEGGYVTPPPSFILGLQALARKHGILIIADEVQAGMGRTGHLWASQLYPGFEPDILTSAKGLASGMPLGACVARSDVMNWEPGSHATTFGGNPVSCAAALKTFELVENGLLDNVRVQGPYLKARLQALADRYDVIGEVRGEGLMLGIEIVESKVSKKKAPDLRNRIVDDCFYHGLLILGCGENSIRFSPPLVICEEQTDSAVRILETVLQQLH